MQNWELIENKKIGKSIRKFFNKKSFKYFISHNLFYLFLFVIFCCFIYKVEWFNIISILIVLFLGFINFNIFSTTILAKKESRKTWLKNDLYKIDGVFKEIKVGENRFYPDKFVIETKQGTFSTTPIVEHVEDIAKGTHFVIVCSKNETFDNSTMVSFTYDDFSKFDKI